MTIKAIIFDLGGVLIELDFSNFYNNIISQSPLESPQTQIMLEFFRESDLYHQGKMSDKDFYELACDLLQVCELNQSAFYEVFNSIVAHPIPETIELLKEIKKKNKYKLLALSNVNSSHWNYILSKEWEFLKYFDEIILSYEVHLTKPNPQLYGIAIYKASFKPEEIVFIDDGINNVRAAKELGIIGIYYKNIDQLKKELEELNIL